MTGTLLMVEMITFLYLSTSLSFTLCPCSHHDPLLARLTRLDDRRNGSGLMHEERADYGKDDARYGYDIEHRPPPVMSQEPDREHRSRGIRRSERSCRG